MYRRFESYRPSQHHRQQEKQALGGPQVAKVPQLVPQPGAGRWRALVVLSEGFLEGGHVGGSKGLLRALLVGLFRDSHAGRGAGL